MLPEIFAFASISAALTAAVFVSHSDTAPGVSDKGYLWYGTLRTLEGCIPIRDFRAYEPGRYYWCALWMLALGPGINAMRIAVHLFFFVGLCAAMTALRLAGIDQATAIAAAVVLSFWAHLSYKLFEPSLLMFTVLGGVLILVDPSPQAFLLAGFIVGISAVIGVNYGLYVGAALFGLTLLAGWKSAEIGLLPPIGMLAVGALMGAAPLLLMFFTVRGFLRAFYKRRVRPILRRRRSNLPLPLPWPWGAPTRTIGGRGAIARAFVQGYFLVLPVFGWGVVAWAVLSPWSLLQEHAAVVAAGFAASFALHHAMSRADFVHLSQVMSPVILGLFALLGDSGIGWVALLLLFGLGSLVTVIPEHPRMIRQRNPEGYVPADLGGARIWLPRGDAAYLDTLRQAIAEHVKPEESVLATPFLVGVYPILNRHSPVYDTFCVHHAGPGEQKEMIREIGRNRVRLALVADIALDDREDRRFSHTHPLVWSHLQAQFALLGAPALPPDYYLFVRKDQDIARTGRASLRTTTQAKEASRQGLPG